MQRHGTLRHRIRGEKANGEEEQRGTDFTGQLAALEHFDGCVWHVCSNEGAVDP